MGISFLVIFGAELVLRLIGFGFMFFDSWPNRIDFTIVLVAFPLSLAAKTVVRDGAGLGLVMVLRLFRLFRIARLFTNFRELNIIVRSFANALVGSFWVLVMMMLMVYVFAIFARTFIGKFQLYVSLEGCYSLRVSHRSK